MIDRRHYGEICPVISLHHSRENKSLRGQKLEDKIKSGIENSQEKGDQENCPQNTLHKTTLYIIVLLVSKRQLTYLDICVKWS